MVAATIVLWGAYWAASEVRRRWDPMSPTRRQRHRGSTPSEGSGSLLGQVGLFESANGLPHGPIAIVLAVAVAVVVYPISRLVRWATRR